MSELFDGATIWARSIFGGSDDAEIAKFAADYASTADYARDAGENVPTPAEFHEAARLAEVNDGAPVVWVLA